LIGFPTTRIMSPICAASRLPDSSLAIMRTINLSGFSNFLLPMPPTKLPENPSPCLPHMGVSGRCVTLADTG
jgi:hypothetical protein